MKSKRVEWVDIAKLIGMFAIYLGHFGTAALVYHIHLFFLFMFHYFSLSRAV